MKRKEFILVFTALITCIIGISYVGIEAYKMIKCENGIYVNMALVSFFVVGCFFGLGISLIGRRKEDAKN